MLCLPQLLSAKKKIGLVAAFYDHQDDTLKLFANGTNMNPTQFREQLRRIFFIKLTDEELGAMICYFDKDGDKCVSSDEFVREFFLLGQKEKRKFL